MRRLKIAYTIKPVWIYVWVAIFALILLLSLINNDNDLLTLVKLGGVALCLFYAAKTFPRDYLLLSAMFATCIADLILANNNTDPVGVIVFLITQFLHLIRLKGEVTPKMIAFSVGAVCILSLDYVFQIIPILYVAAALYAVLLISNIVASSGWHKREPDNTQALMALVGFTLFACCDFCTAISYLSLASVALLPAFFNGPANFFVWLFYYPSQILVSNTGKCVILEAKEGKS